MANPILNEEDLINLIFDGDLSDCEGLEDENVLDILLNEGKKLFHYNII